MSLAGGGSRSRKRQRREEGYHKRELFLRVREREQRSRPPEPAYDIETVKRRAEACGSHFFDKDTLRFFKSRILSDVFPGAHPKIAFFVTSEKGPYGGRRYTVRKQVGCSVKTVGSFQEHSTADKAKRAARKLSGAK